ncbi:hypothetical protein IAT38_003422 [Cryptococcus sp. DSM 104549]
MTAFNADDLYNKKAPLLLREGLTYIASLSLGVQILTGVSLLIFALYLHLWPLREWRLSYRNLQSPPPPSLFWGNFRLTAQQPPNAIYDTWSAAYGPTYRFRTILGFHRLYTSDLTAVSHILSHADLFPKPDQARLFLQDLLGNGLVVAEGADHRQQRKALSPSFSPAAIRSMTPIFFDKAYELRERLLALIEDDPRGEASATPHRPEDTVEGGRKIDVMRFLGKTTLDVIGLAGFDYDFKALSSSGNELADAYRRMVNVRTDPSPAALLQAFFPMFRKLPTKRTRVFRESSAVARGIGMDIVNKKKRAVQEYLDAGIEKEQEVGRDLLSILIQANMTPGLRPDQRLSDSVVLAQITTFMSAGHETSSTALTWTLYNLARHPDAQARLREELLNVPDDRPTLEQLQALPYLDAVVREVLRLYPPVPGTVRQATEDCVIPLGTPVQGRDGKMMESVRVQRGTHLYIPILNINTDPLIWGPTAHTFDPSRFLPPSPTSPPTPSTPLKEAQIPGIWGHLLTFLGGTRNCIGYRFALAEIKAILFVLIRGLEFAELGSKPVVEQKVSVVMRPRVVGEEAAGLQMPLMVKPLSA